MRLGDSGEETLGIVALTITNCFAENTALVHVPVRPALSMMIFIVKVAAENSHRPNR